MRILKITRKSGVPAGSPGKGERGRMQKAERAYLRGDTYFKYKGDVYKVPQSYFVRAMQGEDVIDIPLENFMKKDEKENPS
jgi:hypothetical protein